MKANLYCFLQDQYDGSAFPLFFNTREQAEAYAEGEDQRLCDDIVPIELDFDENGQLLNVAVREDDEEDEE